MNLPCVLSRRRLWGVLALLVCLGCGQPLRPPAVTGAARIAQEYADAVVRQDWTQAHADLHPDSQARFSAERFARLAAQARRDLGCEPREARLRFCDERGDEATAHFIFLGRSGARERHARDAVLLRRHGSGWGVVLPTGFGQRRAP